jgi:hypothetical protein
MKATGTGVGCLIIFILLIGAIIWAIFDSGDGYEPSPRWEKGKKNFWIQAQDDALERGDTPRARFRKRSPEPDMEWYIMNEDED